MSNESGNNTPIFTVKDVLLDHAQRITALEKLAWKLVGGVILGTTLGTTIGGAFVAYLLGKL